MTLRVFCDGEELPNARSWSIASGWVEVWTEGWIGGNHMVEFVFGEVKVIEDNGDPDPQT